METIDLKGREIESVLYGKNELVVKLKPLAFKDGDFIYQKDNICAWVSILKEETDRGANSLDVYASYIISVNDSDSSALGLKIHRECRKVSSKETFRLATDSEKQQLLDAIAKAGKTWNAEKKQVEKLRFRAKVGTCYYSISTIGVYGYIDTDTKPDNIRFNLGNYYQTEEQAQAAFEEVKFVYAKNL